MNTLMIEGCWRWSCEAGEKKRALDALKEDIQFVGGREEDAKDRVR